MKILKRLTAVILVGAMALSLTACGSGKKKVAPKEFKKIMKAADYDVEEGEDEDADECWEAYYTDEDNNGVDIVYYLFESKGDAKACFNKSYDDLKEEYDDELFDGDIEKKSWYFTADGEFDQDSEIIGGNMAGKWYITCIVAEETLLVCYSTPDKASKKNLKNVLADLGYELD
ncbi:MAG: hypothetical protein J6Y58_10650 [Clostridiales bacterium]|nr:hypothetical protein [Clostridiales bacterium]